jgi:hypothetical protein
MAYCNTDEGNSNPIINDVDVTGDVLSGRSGLSLFVRYLRNIVLFPYLEKPFCKKRKSRKGQEISEVFSQLI